MRLCIHFHTGQYHRNYTDTDYFRCKISLFLQKKGKKKLAVSELKESMHFIFFVFTLYHSFPVTLLKVKPKPKRLTSS